MHLDEQALFSDQQAITATAASTNYIDRGAVNTPPGGSNAIRNDLGGGGNIPLLIQVTADFNNLTSLKIDVEVDDNTSFSSAKVVASETVLLADLKAGKIVSPNVVPIGTDERYMRLNYTVTGTAPTTGKVTAGIAGGIQTNG